MRAAHSRHALRRRAHPRLPALRLIKPYKVEIWQGGKDRYLGSYTTAAEAALAYARRLGPAGRRLCPAARGGRHLSARV